MFSESEEDNSSKGFGWIKGKVLKFKKKKKLSNSTCRLNEIKFKQLSITKNILIIQNFILTILTSQKLKKKKFNMVKRNI